MQHVDIGFLLQYYIFSFCYNYGMLLLMLLVLPRKVNYKKAILLAVLYSQLQPIADSVITCLVGGRYIEYSLQCYVVVKVITILEMIIPVFFIRQTIRTNWYKCYWLFLITMIALAPFVVIYSTYFMDTDTMDYYQYMPIRLDNLWVYLLIILGISLIIGVLALLFRKIAIDKQIEKVPNKAWVILNMVFLVMILVLEKDYFDTEQGIEGAKNYRAFIAIFIFIVIFLILVINSTERRILKLENQLLKKQNELQYEGFLGKQENDLELQKLYLDIGNHLKTIQLLVEEGDEQKVSNYAEDILHAYQSVSPKKYSINRIINAVLLEKMTLCEALQISTELEVSLPEELAIRDIDLMCVLSNLLDNAIESCARMKTGQPYIELRASLQNQYCCFYVVNSKPTRQNEGSGDERKTWKNDKKMHGYGLKIIKEIVNRYDGQYEFTETEKEFQALVMITI